MKVAIISDIHDQLDNLNIFLKYSQDNKIQKIICLGDVGKKETVLYLTKNFPGDILLVRGNADLYEDSFLKEIKNLNYFSDFAIEKIGQTKIAFFHEPEKINRLKLNDLEIDFIFYGHTHKPWIEKKDGYFFANPGNLAGLYYPASFAVLETKNNNLNLIILDRI